MQPVDPDIQAQLPTDKIFERPYVGGSGRAVDVMLVTASDSIDIHSPLDCFPSQGWKLGHQHPIILQGEPLNAMEAQQEGWKMTMLYWTTGDYRPPASRYPLVRAGMTPEERWRLTGTEARRGVAPLSRLGMGG